MPLRKNIKLKVSSRRNEVKKNLNDMTTKNIKEILEASVHKKEPIRYILSKGIDSRIIKSHGFTDLILQTFSLRLIRKLNYIPKKLELKKVFGTVPYGELKRSGYTISELKQGGFNIKDIFSCGFTIKNLHTENYRLSSIRKALNPSIHELYKNGYTLKELISSGFKLKDIAYLKAPLRSLLKAGIKFPDLLKIGFSSNQITKAISEIQQIEKNKI